MASPDPSRGVVLAVVPAWIERHCVVPDGWSAGRPFRLVSWQLEATANHWRVRPEAQVPPGQPALEAAAFVYRRSQVVLPQKAGKSPLSAAWVCVEAVGPVLFAGWARGGEQYVCRDHGCPCGWVYDYLPGEPMGWPWPSPLIQITGPSQDNTDNVYRALRPMIENGRLSAVIPRTTEEFIRVPGGEIVPVTSSANTRLGNPLTFAIQDETGVWTKQNRMVAVAETQRRGLAGMKGRAIETTNAWDPAEQSVAQRTFETHSEDVYRLMPQAPPRLSYGNRVERARIHRAVYAGSHWVDLDVIDAEAQELLESDPHQAERFYGNRLVHGQAAWMPDGAWEAAEADVEVPQAAPVCLGFDGSKNNDWTSIRACTMDGHRFTPLYGPQRRTTTWKPDQWDGSIPRSEVRVALEEIFRCFTVVRLYADPGGARTVDDPDGWDTEIDEWSRAHGSEIVIAWPTYKVERMYPALRRYLSDVKSATTTHDRDPDASLCAANARTKAQSGDRYLLQKPDQARKIDVTMADVLAYEARADALTAGWTDAPTDNRMFVLR